MVEVVPCNEAKEELDSIFSPRFLDGLLELIMHWEVVNYHFHLHQVVKIDFLFENLHHEELLLPSIKLLIHVLSMHFEGSCLGEV